MTRVSGTKRKRNGGASRTMPTRYADTPTTIVTRLQTLENGIWDAFFSNGMPLNLSPRLLKSSNVKDFRVGVNDFRLKVPNTVRAWACQTHMNPWANVQLGHYVCSNAFSRWIRSGKQSQNYRSGYKRYEQALRADFKRADGLPGYGMVFRGMPKLPRAGLVDASPISATRRLHIASRYAGMQGCKLSDAGSRTGHQVVALLLPPGTKVLPYGGEDGEYLLPPGKIVPVHGRQRAEITRFETFVANADLQLIDSMVYFSKHYGPLHTYHTDPSFTQRPARKKVTVRVTPAVFKPDPRWN